MTQLTLAAIVTEAVHVNMSRVLEAMGEGANGFQDGAKLAPIGDVYNCTHRMLNWAQANETLANEFLAMAASQTLPDISPNQWGVNGIISAADAQAAMLGLVVITYAGPSTDVVQWRTTQLTSMNLTWWVWEE